MKNSNGKNPINSSGFAKPIKSTNGNDGGENGKEKMYNTSHNQKTISTPPPSYSQVFDFLLENNSMNPTHTLIQSRDKTPFSLLHSE